MVSQANPSDEMSDIASKTPPNPFDLWMPPDEWLLTGCPI
jgi:hypothetical protein